jgi:hypothetical protein
LSKLALILSSIIIAFLIITSLLFAFIT